MEIGGPPKANQNALTPKPPYRHDINGLRGLAVIAVIINHFDHQLLPSGYLGVDIFFVISGFVITASLRSRHSKDFKDFLSSFYTRRVKRLIPALLIFIVPTSIIIWLLNQSPRTPLMTGVMSLFGLSNFYLFNQATDYFATSTALNPFTHTWSLGVEEQFYFLFPVITWLTGFSRQTTRGASYLFGAMAALSIASLTVFIYLYPINQPAAYFLMPTRFWEMGAGCLLFLALNRGSSLLKRLQNISSSLIAIAIVAVLVLPLKLAVPATMAMVILTAALIACLRSGAIAYQLFTHPWLTHIGLISYSLYLWHWGILALSRLTLGIHWWSVPFQAALMFWLATVSYRYVETPLRHANWGETRSRTISYGGLSSLGSALLVTLLSAVRSPLLIPGVNDIAEPPDFLRLKGSGKRFNPTCVVDGKRRPLTEQTFEQCTTPPKTNLGQMLWVLGDSHAGHLQGLLYQMHDQMGLGIHLIETPGVPFPMTQDTQLRERQLIFEQIQSQLKPGDIVLVARLLMERDKDNRVVPDFSEWMSKVQLLAEELAARDISLVIVGPPPIFQIEGIDLCRSSLWLALRRDCSVERAEVAEKTDRISDALETAALLHRNIHVFAPFPFLCPPDQEKCSVQINDRLAYRDKDHLNSDGAAALAEPFTEFLEKHRLLKSP